MTARCVALALSAFLYSYIAAAGGTTAASAGAAGAPGAALRVKHTELREALGKNAFGRALHLDSRQSADHLQGELHAVLDHPFPKLADALSKPQGWCEILVMPMHVQRCNGGNGEVDLQATTKLGPAAGNSANLRLAFKVAARTPDYLSINLSAPEGPLGTRDYRVAIEAVPVDAARTFIHLTYSYGYGTMAKVATNTYLSTSGKDKPGFTAGGMRGILERNAMRYLLAMDAYLASLDGTAQQRVDRRLKTWHASLERYPRQLHEPQPDYLALKREQMLALAR